MKKTIQELKQERGALEDKVSALLNLAETQQRNLSKEEAAQFKQYEDQIKSLDSQIETEERAEAFRVSRSANVAPVTGGETKEKSKVSKRFSIAKAVRAKLLNQPLDGLEAEMHQEATKEMRSIGRSLEGFGIPSFLTNFEKRAMTVGTNADGGFTVPTNLGELIPALQPRLKVVELGATVMTGLTGNFDRPREASTPTATWEGETDANAESQSTLEKVSWSPKRLGAYTEESKQLMIQSNSIGVETYLRNRLELAISQKLDSTAINGTGTAPIPTGILNTTGINAVAIDTNGGALTRALLVQMEKEIANDNADQGTLSFLTTPGVREFLRNLKTDAGSGQFVWPETNNQLLGYRAEISTQVPSNLTKGTGTNLNAIILGYWAGFQIAQWGGVDIVVNPYVKDINAIVRVTANTWWDMAPIHPEYFCVIKDVSLA